MAAHPAGPRPARNGARLARTLAAIVSVVLVLALSPSGPAAAAPGPRDGGELFGRATRSTAPAPAAVEAVPAGFSDTVAFGGLTLPTAIAFAPGGKVFVGEKGGVVKVFDSLADSAPAQVVDLRSRVQDFWDRGLLGLAVDPGFGTAGRNFVYVLYTHDSTLRAARSPGATPAPARQGPPPTAARSPATCPGSRSTLRPGWPAGRSSR